MADLRRRRVGVVVVVQHVQHHADAAALTPILASMPYSVTVSTTRPSGNGIVHVNQPSDIASYQSQVCTATGGRPGGSEMTEEHSV